MLSDLTFSDLCISSAPDLAWYKETPGARETKAVPASYHPEIWQLWLALSAEADRGANEFKVDFDGMRLRVERMQTTGAGSGPETLFICRRFANQVQKLSQIGFPLPVVSKLLGPELKDGLLIFMGKTGSMKTTSLVSFITEWLTVQGGVCWTVENPVEIAFQGRWGAGVCYQTEVKDDAQFASAVRQILRSSPDVIMIGEIRGGVATSDVLHAATSGHLIGTTFHANDIISGLTRFSMNSDAGYLADALRAVIYLERKKKPAGETYLALDTLFISGPNADAMRSTIRKGEFHLLKSEIDRQRREFMMTGGGS